MDERVEPYVDDTLPPAERNRFERRMRRSAYWQHQVRLARRLRATFEAWPVPPPPSAEPIGDGDARCACSDS